MIHTAANASAVKCCHMIQDFVEPSLPDPYEIISFCNGLGNVGLNMLGHCAHALMYDGAERGGVTGVSSVDPVRCLRLGTYGLAIDGPFGHLWYKILDRTVEPKNPQVWALKRLRVLAGETWVKLCMTAENWQNWTPANLDVLDRRCALGVPFGVIAILVPGDPGTGRSNFFEVHQLAWCINRHVN